MKPFFLHVRSGPAAGRVVEVGRQGARIGRDASCELQLRDNLVSKLHAEVFVDLLSSNFVVRDLGSKNGLHVNGEATVERTLAAGDEVRVGRSRIVCVDRAPDQGSLEGASRALTALAELGRIAVDAEPLDSLDAFAAKLRDAAGVTGAAIAVYEEGAEKPLVEAHVSDREPLARGTAKLAREKLGESDGDLPLGADEPAPLRALMAEAARSRCAVLVDDAAERADLAGEPVVREGRVRFYLALPMVVGGTLLGVAVVYGADPGIEPAARAATEAAVALIGLALERSL